MEFLDSMLVNGFYETHNILCREFRNSLWYLRDTLYILQQYAHLALNRNKNRSVNCIANRLD